MDGFKTNAVSQHEAELRKAQDAIESSPLAQELQEIEQWKAKLADLSADIPNMIEAEPKALDFFVKDRVLAGRGFLVTGLGGSSKSRMLYHFAIAAAIGKMPWDWEVCKRGKAVLFLTEDTREDVHRTIYHMARALRLSEYELKRVKDNVIIFPLAGELFQMLKAKGADLVRSPLFEACVEYINELGNVQFIGLDPALSLTQGDELNQGHQRALGQIADHMGVITGAACGMVSHAAKGISSKEDLDSHNSRGGGAITDAVRAEITMRTMTPDEARRAKLDDMDERHNYVQVAITKANHLPPSAKKSLWLTRADGGTLLPAESLEFAEAGTKGNSAQMACLNVLVEKTKTATIKTSEWMSLCFDAGLFTIKAGSADPKEAKKKAFQRITKPLLEGGFIKAGSFGVMVPADYLLTEGGIEG